MQTKTKNQLRKDLRRLHEQTGAAMLVFGLLAGTFAVSQELRHTVTQLAARPVFSIIEHSNKGSETAEQSTRFERVAPASLIGGQ